MIYLTIFIKITLSLLARPLSYLSNCLLFNGTFPDSWKIARVALILKAGSADEPSNYRPISAIIVLSGIFEKLVYNHLYSYLNEKNSSAGTSQVFFDLSIQ